MADKESVVVASAISDKDLLANVERVLEHLTQVDEQAVVKAEDTEDFFLAVMKVLEQLLDMVHYKTDIPDDMRPALEQFSSYYANQLERSRIVSKMNCFWATGGIE